MSRESELQAEIDAKTKDFEKIRNEKEAAEEKMRIHIQNLDLADKIEYVQNALKSTGTDYIKKVGYSFVFGKTEKEAESFIQFRNEWVIRFPDDPELFDELIDKIYDILEKKKNKLKEI